MSSADDGHNYTFGAPKKGWPSFGPDGKIVRDESVPAGPEPCRVTGRVERCLKWEIASQDCGERCEA